MKNKRICSLALALSIFLSGAVYSSAAIKGDINGSGALEAADARLALRYSVGLEDFTEEQAAQADMDSDGAVTAADARTILRLSVGLGEDVKPISNPKFETALYSVAHPLLGQGKPMYDNSLMKNFQKWCCYYTIHDVFRPALEKAGYSKEDINRLAPNTFSKDILSKALSNGVGINWPAQFVLSGIPIYVPSVLMSYYYENPDAAEVYSFYDYYDDVVEEKIFYGSKTDAARYSPRVGDVLFMSNKTRTYENGYPTIDHTAQIIEVYADGTFLCTEGSIIEPSEGDELAKVRERVYRFNSEIGTYEYVNNNIVIVLTAVRPDL